MRWSGDVVGLELLTAGCSLSSPAVSSGRPGWPPARPSVCAHVLGSGNVRCVPAGTSLWTLWAETAYCGACRWRRPPTAWRTAARRWRAAAEARPRCCQCPDGQRMERRASASDQCTHKILLTQELSKKKKKCGKKRAFNAFQFFCCTESYNCVRIWQWHKRISSNI